MSDAAAESKTCPAIRDPEGQAPPKQCDLILRGGIVSGIVYPHAVAKLSGTYRFRSLGGASSGAMAAAVTAAAEVGWQTGRNRYSFARMLELTEMLNEPAAGPGSESALYHLFQPQPATRSLFRILLQALSNAPLDADAPAADRQGGARQANWRRWGGQAGRLLATARRVYPLAAAVGALPGVVVLVMLVSLWLRLANPSWLGGMIYGAALVCALLFAFVGAVAATAIRFVWQAFHVIPDNNYGLCSGYAPPQDGQPRALTVWLAEVLDELAGKESTGEPLTCGDLKNAKVTLKLVTTCLTQGRPYTVPFADDPAHEASRFYFDPDEFKQLLPETVVNWMVEHAGPAHDGTVEYKGHRLVKLPCAANLPVVVAARLSLSFPILLSMVPLYAVHPTQRDTKEGHSNDEKVRAAERCWFSDGGITTNFPIHFFDAPIPRWPTFGISLRDFDREFPAVAREASKVDVWMAQGNHDADMRGWIDLDAGGWTRLFGFGATIVNTMRTWSDNLQAEIHGYRDRVAHVYLAGHEGGLNLKMETRVTKGLHARGQKAAEKLLARFADPHTDAELSWNNHRWIRLRSTLAVLVDMLGRIQKGYAWDEGADWPLPTYAALLKREEGVRPDAYWLDPVRQELASELLEELVGLAPKTQADADSGDAVNDRRDTKRLGEDAPKPEPLLQIRPDL